MQVTMNQNDSWKVMQHLRHVIPATTLAWDQPGQNGTYLKPCFPHIKFFSQEILQIVNEIILYSPDSPLAFYLSYYLIPFPWSGTNYYFQPFPPFFSAPRHMETFIAINIFDKGYAFENQSRFGHRAHILSHFGGSKPDIFV